MSLSRESCLSRDEAKDAGEPWHQPEEVAMAILLGRLRARHLSVCLSVGERVNEHTRRCRCAHGGQRTIETDVPHWSMPLELAVLVRLAVESPRSLPPQCWGPEHQSLSWFRGSNSGPHDHKTNSFLILTELPPQPLPGDSTGTEATTFVQRESQGTRGSRPENSGTLPTRGRPCS